MAELMLLLLLLLHLLLLLMVLLVKLRILDITEDVASACPAGCISPNQRDNIIKGELGGSRRSIDFQLIQVRKKNLSGSSSKGGKEDRVWCEVT